MKVAFGASVENQDKDTKYPMQLELEDAEWEGWLVLETDGGVLQACISRDEAKEYLICRVSLQDLLLAVETIKRHVEEANRRGS